MSEIKVWLENKLDQEKTLSILDLESLVLKYDTWDKNFEGFWPLERKIRHFLSIQRFNDKVFVWDDNLVDYIAENR